MYFKMCCFGKGDETNNKCSECNQNMIFFDNKKNCYNKCNYYFYFDNEKYTCTDEDKCP